MSTKTTTKKNSKPAATKKPAAKTTASKVTPPKSEKAKAGRGSAPATTTTTDGNLTIVEVPPATVETIVTIEKPTKRTRKKPETQPARKPLSQLEAAVKVLGESTEPLTTKEMVEAMAAKKYWSSPGGKTPHATLYSAILRELQTKGEASRFLKTDRGHFPLRQA
jgi:hypothetical protein